MKYQVNEIFYSLQGEGRNTGMPAVFIRLASCNLSCEWCDTDYSEKFEAGADSIADKCKQYPTRNVVITGGEPTEQNLYRLLHALRDHGYYIAVETNGTNNLERLRAMISWLTVSPKRKIGVSCRIDELKVIWPTDLSLPHLANIPASYRYIQPRDDENGPQNTKAAIEFVKEHPKWRLSVQMHKVLGLR